MQKKGKAPGFAAEDCLDCHEERPPEKEAITYDDRGEWLVAEKQKRKAAGVDMARLEDYPGDGK